MHDDLQSSGHGKTVFYVEVSSITSIQLGLVSVIWNSGVSALQGFLRYGSLLRSDRDLNNCLLYHVEGCLLSGVPCTLTG